MYVLYTKRLNLIKEYLHLVDCILGLLKYLLVLIIVGIPEEMVNFA